jgi:hypothetical protein
MTREESIKLTVKSLLEVVQTGAKNIEISVMEGYSKVTVCRDDGLRLLRVLNGFIVEFGAVGNRSYRRRNREGEGGR